MGLFYKLPSPHGAHRLSSKGPPIGNGLWWIKWSWWRYLTLKGHDLDTNIFEAHYLDERTTWGSNGHVTDDVTWPWKVNDVTPICLGPISRKRLEVKARFQRTTNNKHSMANRMVTWPVTSSDLERSSQRSSHDPDMFGPSISTMAGDTDSFTTDLLQKVQPGVSNGHVPDDVTWT